MEESRAWRQRLRRLASAPVLTAGGARDVAVDMEPAAGNVARLHALQQAAGRARDKAQALDLQVAVLLRHLLAPVTDLGQAAIRMWSVDNSYQKRVRHHVEAVLRDMDMLEEAYRWYDAPTVARHRSAAFRLEELDPAARVAVLQALLAQEHVEYGLSLPASSCSDRCSRGVQTDGDCGGATASAAGHDSAGEAAPAFPPAEHGKAVRIASRGTQTSDVAAAAKVAAKAAPRASSSRRPPQRALVAAGPSGMRAAKPTPHSFSPVAWSTEAHKRLLQTKASSGPSSDDMYCPEPPVHASVFSVTRAEKPTWGLPPREEGGEDGGRRAWAFLRDLQDCYAALWEAQQRHLVVVQGLLGQARDRPTWDEPAQPGAVLQEGPESQSLLLSELWLLRSELERLLHVAERVAASLEELQRQLQAPPPPQPPPPPPPKPSTPPPPPPPPPPEPSTPPPTPQDSPDLPPPEQAREAIDVFEESSTVKGRVSAWFADLKSVFHGRQT